MDYFAIDVDKGVSGRQSPLALAHLGDAVFELMARTHLLLKAPKTVKDLHAETVRIVSASSQSAALDKIDAMLTEEERAAVKRGRNAPVGTARKNVDRAAYQRATGLETLFGTLYLEGKRERLCELFAAIVA